MAAINTGTRPPNGKGRATLSVRDPLVETLLAGLGVEEEILDQLRAFCKYWVRERNAFSIKNSRSGLFGNRHIRKDEADKLLTRALAELAEGGAA